MSFSGSDAYLSYLPEFCAKTESAVNPLPRSFCVRSLDDFVGNLPDELLLCPVRALCSYLARTSSLVSRPRTLFVSPCSPSRSLSKNALSFFGMSSLVLTRPPPLLLLLLALLPPLLRLLRCVLIVLVGWLLRGHLRVMLLSLPSWLRLGPLLLYSPPSVFPMFSSLRVVLVWVLWWPLVLWCRFLDVLSFCSLFVHSVTAGSVYPLGGGCSLFIAALLCLRCVGFREWHFDARWSPGLTNSL